MLWQFHALACVKMALACAMLHRLATSAAANESAMQTATQPCRIMPSRAATASGDIGMLMATAFPAGAGI
jgi:hypothetical protein